MLSTRGKKKKKIIVLLHTNIHNVKKFQFILEVDKNEFFFFFEKNIIQNHKPKLNKGFSL